MNDIRCPKCGQIVMAGDLFCGFCGCNLIDSSSEKEDQTEEFYQEDLPELLQINDEDNIKNIKEVEKYEDNLLLEPQEEKTVIPQDQMKYKKVNLAEERAKIKEEIIRRNETAKLFVIDSEGNKFKAIKMFMNEFDCGIDEAGDYIDRAYKAVLSRPAKKQECAVKKVEASVDVKDDIETMIRRLEPESETEEFVMRMLIPRKPISRADRMEAVAKVMGIYGYKESEANTLVQYVYGKIFYYNPSKPIAPKQRKIVKTIIVGQNSRKKVFSTVSRGFVGGALIGPVGLLAGATGKTKDMTTFQVIYSDGSQETATVNNKSAKFREYCKYLNTGDR